MALRLMMGIVKGAIPVGMSPTTLTPYLAFNCSSDETTIPSTNATSAPGISGLKRLITRIRTIVPTPSARE